MGKIAFIFPGQGSQYAGMGKEIHDKFAVAREVFVEADEAVEFSLSGLCFHGPKEELKLTENTQPAVLTVSIAILRLLREKGLQPDFVAGHSLGEYSALVCAGALTLQRAVRLVRNRGRYMQEAVPEGRGAMVAILGLDAATVEEVCRAVSNGGLVAPANFNSPDQTVIAGDALAVRRASDLAKEKGARRVLPLPVSAPFHCELMAPARDRLAADLGGLELSDLKVPLVNNVDVHEVRLGEEARESLIRQVCAPVRWVETIQFLAAAGVDKFIEVGPGRVLSGLTGKIVPHVQTFNVEDARGLEALASVVSGVTM